MSLYKSSKDREKQRERQKNRRNILIFKTFKMYGVIEFQVIKSSLILAARWLFVKRQFLDKHRI